MGIERRKKILSGIGAPEVGHLYQFALEVADRTRSLIVGLWESGDFSQKDKDDKTPVTEIDLRAEELVRELVTRRFPDHGIMGEEYEPTRAEGDFQWTIDPIDGTQNLIQRIPTFGTLLGLRFRGEAVLGIIDHPAMNLRTSGGYGLGVTQNGRPVALADIPGTSLSSSDLVVTNNLAVFDRSPEGRQLFERAFYLHPHTRVFYDCYAHTLAVVGSVAVVVEPNLRIWDVTPAEAMLLELGGKYVRLRGCADSSRGLIDSVFGKPKAVDLMCAHIAGVVE